MALLFADLSLVAESLRQRHREALHNWPGFEDKAEEHLQRLSKEKAEITKIRQE